MQVMKQEKEGKRGKGARGSEKRVKVKNCHAEGKAED